MVIDSNFYMSLALNEAWRYQGLTYPNPAVGALVLDRNGQILSIAAHKEANCAHAELLAVKEALLKLNPTLISPKDPNRLHKFIIDNHNNLLKDSTIFVTLEPCNHQGKTPPCSKLLSSIKPKRVYIGSLEKNNIASGGAEYLKKEGIEVVSGVLKKECDLLIEPFLSWRDGHFSFIKVAMSANGVLDGGVISSKESRELVHALRDKITTLAIGGNSVRIDRPTLDARMINGRAPEVFIYSRQKEFDKNIALFGVKNRKVTISSNWDEFKSSNFGMIEAGVNLFNNCPSFTKWLLLFKSSKFKIGKTIQATKDYKLVWQGRNSEDSFGWYVKE
ncbi:MAG: bifunctional diaminohydroxyphosphoribosylaminopyrimidine deaminase/5-amino-6-(5-phosphoribosylamino)uracil reductase RibD [Sulfurospirillaceae bacterium]|nr:bifunctional diaminohydroxyphosphoribosylaminopyrimidine deaminase/5-amino-6-(5-phosphoribosylamino)uracil reductase RibD [Sulfurospirillaceae bacterium]